MKLTQYIKYFGLNPYPDFDYATYVDKHKAKMFVKDVVNVATEYAYFTTPEQIDAFDFNTLANKKYYIKGTHGWRWQIKSGDIRDFNSTKERMKSWLNKTYNPRGERQYSFLEQGVLIEEDLGDRLTEYKLWYIHGELQFIEARQPNSSNRSHYDKDWNLQPFMRLRNQSSYDASMPHNLWDILRKGESLINLIKKPPFVRIDLYSKRVCCNRHKVYFSEYTFTPAAGSNPFTPDEWEIHFGNKIKEKL